MHYFQLEIKEWVANTAHLTLEEESAYLRLILYYYDSERPLPVKDIDMIFRKCRIPTELGENLLVEFFTQTDEAWTHKRCEAELARYRGKKQQASKAGQASAAARFNGRSTGVQPIINQESLIINQESLKEKKPTKVGTPDGVSDLIWSDFVALRKAKKAKLTETALKGLEREARKAQIPLEDALRICCERGWAGFKAEWIDSHLSQKPDKNLAIARAIFGDERRLQDDFKTLT